MGQIWLLGHSLQVPETKQRSSGITLTFWVSEKNDGKTMYPTSGQTNVVSRSEPPEESTYNTDLLMPFSAWSPSGLTFAWVWPSHPIFFPSLILCHCHMPCAVQPCRALDCFLISFAESCPQTFAGAAPLLRRLPLPLANSHSLSETLFKRLYLDVSPESVSWVKFPSFLFPPHSIQAYTSSIQRQSDPF